jgi:glucose/arabinose dehydrogenase
VEPLESRDQPAVLLPPGFVNTTYAAGFAEPTAMDFAPDGRLFVADKVGTLWVVDPRLGQPTPFVTVPVNTRQERGLDGVVLDPNFEQNGFVYVYYSRPVGRRVINVLSRFTADPADPDVALPGSELPLLTCPSPTTVHNGGSMQFGPDAMLYLGIGDGGTGGGLAQSLAFVNGKILRLDVDHYPFLIPPGNPFARRGRGKPQIWALGFRNPYTSAFDPATGLFFVNDVGEDTWEEIDPVLPGRNYGWPSAEGAGGVSGMTNPVYQYHHFTAGGVEADAITGGVFYRGGSFPALYQGAYFFADYLKGFIRMLPAGHYRRALTFALGAPAPVDLDVGPDGGLFYLSINTGTVQEITFAG